MSNIKPGSDLRNCKTKAVIKLMGELAKGEKSAQEKGWIEISGVEKLLGIANK